MKKRRPSNRIWIPKEVMSSKAFLGLSGKALHVYLIFLTKRQMKEIKTMGRLEWIQTNNGELQFTYQEAKENFGISAQAFQRSLDQLINYGFLDVSRPGAGMYKVPTLYSLSERWRDYDTPAFRSEERKKHNDWPGFQKGHRGLGK